MSDTQRKTTLELADKFGIRQVDDREKIGQMASAHCRAVDEEGTPIWYFDDVMEFVRALATASTPAAVQAPWAAVAPHTAAQTAAPHDAVLAAAITRAADQLRFDNRPGSIERQCTLGLFVAALSDRLALAFPQSADALKAVVFSPATRSNPVETSAPTAQKQ